MHRILASAVSRSHRFLLAAMLVAILVPPLATDAQLCVGDCGKEGAVTADDLLSMVSVARGGTDASACDPGDADKSGAIRVDEILLAVNNAVNDCSPPPTPTATPVGHSFVGDYFGTTASYGVRFHVAADTTASGFIDFLGGVGLVTQGVRPADVLASYPASGQADLATGDYHLSGAFFDQPFAFMGRLPASPDTSGTLSVTVFGQTSEGTLRAGTPPPSPTTTPTPGCNSADLQITFSAVSGDFNGVESNFAAQRTNIALEQVAPDYIAGLHEVYNSTLNVTECEPQGVRLRGVQIQTFEVLGGLAAGQSFPISLTGSTDGSATAIVFYGEEGSGGDRVWTSNAGTVFIDSVFGSAVTVRVVGATMTQTAGDGTGSFTLDANGQVTGFGRQIN